MDKIVILGGTGFIGSRLVDLLKDKYMLVVLTRHPTHYQSTEKVQYLAWDADNLSQNPIDGAYAVINLAGESIAGWWSKAHKVQIKQSRIVAGHYVASAIRKAHIKPRVWIQASATGFYGSSTQTMNEQTSRGKGYLAEVCEAWELAARELDVHGVRVAIVRTGLVLSPEGGLWKQLEQSYILSTGLILGSGKQFLPWIAMDDELAAIQFLLENNACEGVFNLTAPQACTMAELVHGVGQSHFHLLTVRVPGWLLSWIVGKEVAQNVLLTDQRVVPSRLLAAGYNFRYAALQSFIANNLPG